MELWAERKWVSAYINHIFLSWWCLLLCHAPDKLAILSGHLWKIKIVCMCEYGWKILCTHTHYTTHSTVSRIVRSFFPDPLFSLSLYFMCRTIFILYYGAPLIADKQKRAKERKNACNGSVLTGKEWLRWELFFSVNIPLCNIVV